MANEFAYLRQFLKQQAGIVISEDKDYLIESRLLPIAHRNQLTSVTALIAQLMSQKADQSLATQVVDAMTTNETFFFRDKTPFDQFTNVILPAMKAARGSKKHLRIWCAACSAGQEPYSLAMILKEKEHELAGWKFDIIATDLCTEVLEKAKAGIYTQFEVQRGLATPLLLKYFEKIGEGWHISPKIKAMVQYKPLNLIKDFNTMGTFDVVFCRNVLIYFDQETKTDILNRVSKQLSPDGYLLLGAAETVVGLTTNFKPHPESRGLYCQDGKAGVSAGSNVSMFPKTAALGGGR